MSTTNGTPADDFVDPELGDDAEQYRPDQIPDVDGDPSSPDVSIDEVDLTPYPLPSDEEIEEAAR